MGMTEIWESVLKILRNDISHVSYETWIKSLKVLAIEENCFILYTENKIIPKMVEARYAKKIEEVLLSITGREYRLKVVA